MKTTNPESSINIVFAGTPAFAATALQAIINHPSIGLLAVYSQPDRPKGRGRKLSHSPVKQLALDNNIPVFQPLNFKEQTDIDQLASLNADVLVVAAYGLLLPKAVLQIPRLGCINIHASLLPKWRGAAPIERAIEQGDGQTGVTIMQMDEGLDTGAMILKKTSVISKDDTGDSMRKSLATLGGDAILEVLELLEANNESSHEHEAQDDSLASYAKKVSKNDLQLNWNVPAEHLARKIRAFYSTYTAYTVLGEQRIKIGAATATEQQHKHTPGTIIEANKQQISVAAAQGTLHITALQLPGSRMMAVSKIMNAKATLFQQGFQFNSPDTA